MIATILVWIAFVTLSILTLGGLKQLTSADSGGEISLILIVMLVFIVASVVLGHVAITGSFTL